MGPITGPHSTLTEMRWPPGLAPLTVPSNSWVNLRVYRSWYRQKKPYNLPLPFIYEAQSVDIYPSNGVDRAYPHFDAINSTGVVGIKGELSDSHTLNTALGKAHNKFRDQIGESAEWMTSWIERSQSLTTMAKRIESMTKFVTKLKRFDFVGAFNALVRQDFQDPIAKRRFKSRKALLDWQRRMRKKFEAENRSNLKRGSKYFADNFLEYQFFWAPTVDDIYATADILQQEIEPLYIKSHGVGKRDEVLYPLDAANRVEVRMKATVRIGGKVAVQNPNLWLANQLGLVNPALWAYEAVTLSFVANWFVNISDFLGNLTRYAGLSFTDTWHTISHRETREWQWSDSRANPPWFVSGRNSSLRVERKTGLPPGPALQLRAPWQLQPKRAAVAVSLLIQKLR